MLPKRIMSWITAIAIVLLFSISSALAADGRPPTSAYGGIWLALAIAYLTRRRKFGGWLFYYYLTAYVGTVVLFLMLAFSLHDYQPSGWEDKALYTLFIISTLPFYLLTLVEVIVATLLLFKSYRSQQFINYLKYVLIAEVIVEVLTFFIDYTHFPENVGFTVFGGLFSLIWLLYFSDSYRVYYVLANPGWHWNYEDFKKSKSQSKLVNKAS